MSARGKKLLRFTGILEILIGIGSFTLIFWVLSSDAEEMSGVGASILHAKSTLWTLVLIYATAGLHVLAGIVGVLFAGNAKKYKLHYFFGICLILLISSSFVSTGNFEVTNIIANSVSLLVPAYYLYGAMKNKQSYEER